MRVVIAEPGPVRRQRLAAALRRAAGVEVVAAAGSLMEAYTVVEAEVPDLALVGAAFGAAPEYPMFAQMMRLLGIRALPLGEAAADGIETPILREVLRLAALGPPPVAPDPCMPRMPAAVRRTAPAGAQAVVVIGASTGGVEALHAVLGAFPADCPPTLVVQHIRGAFSAAFAARLGRNCAAVVTEARDGLALTAGLIAIAPGDACHLEVRPGQPASCHLRAGPPVSGHRPSVDALFRSAAALGPRVVGALLTGMGRDGAEGLLAVREAGGHTIAQDRETCTVYGMPRVAAELGAAREILPLGQVAQAILRAAAPAAPPELAGQGGVG